MNMFANFTFKEQFLQLSVMVSLIHLSQPSPCLSSYLFNAYEYHGCYENLIENTF